MTEELNDRMETIKRPKKAKARDYKGDLSRLQGRVDTALVLFGKVPDLPVLAKAAVEILEGK